MTQSTRIPYPVFFSYVGYIIFSLFLAAAVLEIGSSFVRSVHHWMLFGKAEGFAGTSPAYQGYPWAQDLWKEDRLREQSSTGRPGYLPFLVWGERPWHGKYVNVDESVLGNLRRTVNTTNPNCSQSQRKVIWVFGGSTAFGLGVPDAETIPSHLSQELNSTGPGCFVILNLGAEGYLSNQELILLLVDLKTGQRPDVAIFYDGVNEAYAAVSPGIPNAHLEFEHIRERVEGSVTGRLDFLRNSDALQIARAIANRFQGGNPSPSSAEVAARAAAALDNYETNIRILRILGEAYKFKVFCFWQPSLASGDKPLVPFEQQLLKNGLGSPDAKSYKILKAVNEEAARRSLLDGRFVYLGQLFDSVKEPLYVDHLMHLEPRGNQIVALTIAKWMESHPENEQ
jgi:lysophospholipase L1-like esterase